MPESKMLGCSANSSFHDDDNLLCEHPRPVNKLSKAARNFCRSTEDLCKSSDLYKIWDQRQMIRNWRHAAWDLLQDHQVVCAIWLDDVLAFHGAEQPLGDYCLLVHNPRVAAGILSLYGYRSIGWANDRSVIGQLNCQRIKMSAARAKVDVVLLSASEWCYDLSPDALHDGLCPYLPEFIGAMIDLWLKIPPGSQRHYSYLMNFLSKTIHECYHLNDFGDDVCEDDYAVWLRPHHREVHFDIVARSKGYVKDNLDFPSRHKHHVHKACLINQGKFVPRPRRKRAYSPQLAVLAETPEDTKPATKRACRPYLIATDSFRVVPSSNEIGIAL